MIRRIKYGLFLTGLLFCCLFSGYYFGYCQGKGIGPEEVLLRNTDPEITKIAYNRTIAIVNLDEGTQQGGQENYGVRLIDTITDDVVITGLEDARRGIENGTYSAYMVIPAAFSERISTITARPVKSEITYAIGSRLAGAERDEVIYRMESIFRLFNNNLSKVYLSSVLAAYHKAQDSASSIISNDTEDMELLLQVRGEDLIEYIETPEVTIVDNEISELDLTDHYTKNSQTVEEIHTAYQDFNEKGAEAMESLKEGFDRTSETIGELKEELEAMGETMKNYADTPWDDSEQAAREDALYQAGKAALTGVPDTEGDGSGDGTGGSGTKEEGTGDNGADGDETGGDGTEGDGAGGDETEEEQTEGILTAYNTSLQEKQKELLTGFLNQLRSDSGLPGQDRQEVYIEEFLNKQAAFPLIDIGAVEQEIDSLIQTAKDSRTLRNEEIEGRRETWEQIRERMETLRTSYEEVDAANEETRAAMTSFDMASFIDEGVISDYLMQIEDSLRDVETKVSDQIFDYEDYVSDVYEAADNDIRSFEEEIARGQEQSEEKLNQGLEEAKNSRQENNENNLRLLNELIVQMPYTRIGEVENREVYDFIAEPVLTNNQSAAQAAVWEQEGLRMETVVSLSVFCGFILLLGGARLAFWRRRKMTEQWE